MVKPIQAVVYVVAASLVLSCLLAGMGMHQGNAALVRAAAIVFVAGVVVAFMPLLALGALAAWQAARALLVRGRKPAGD